jgi:hypothetical protein
MNQITFFIAGIATLVFIPVVYLCFNRFFNKKATVKSKIISAISVLVMGAFLAFAAINAYFYVINVQDSIVAERYVTSLVINSGNNNLKKHIEDTALISYKDIEGLEDAFEKTANIKGKQINSLAISNRRWTCEEGFTHLYLYLDGYNICYDIGLIQKDAFWDVSSIAVLSPLDQNDVLAHEAFTKQK